MNNIIEVYNAAYAPWVFWFVQVARRLLTILPFTK